jgi:riboflavin biosynthesis pyrimidine reductase
MSLTPLFPAPGDPLDPSAPDGRARIVELYRPPAGEWLRVNLVTSLTGAAAGADGTSDSLSNAVDRQVLGVVRELADVVLVGAASVRLEGYRVPRRSRLAVVTTSGDLTGHRFEATDDPILVLCPIEAVDTVQRTMPGLRPEIVVLPTTLAGITAADLLGALRERGLLSVVCEGGPDLVARLLRADAVDELCLTTAATATPVAIPAFADGFTDREMHCAGLAIDDRHFLYTRWVSGAAPASG